MYLKTNAFDMEGDDNDIVIVSGPGPHGHAAEAELVATTALIEQMLAMVAADPSRPSKRVYDQVIGLTGYMIFL